MTVAPKAAQTQADAQDRDVRPQGPDHLDDHAGILRPAGAGGKDDPRRRELPDLLRGHFIVADDPDIRLDLAHQLIEVIGKAVVIVDQQDHNSSSCASSSARREARALFRLSSYSFSGTESATIPAPLRTNTFPFFL